MGRTYLMSQHVQCLSKTGMRHALSDNELRSRREKKQENLSRDG